MLPNYLSKFNDALLEFQEKYPRKKWSAEFENSLVNDYSFYSARVEDAKLQYGDTIKFLNNETIRGVNLTSLIGISEHQKVLKNLLDNLKEFRLTEKIIKALHRSLMESPLSWDNEYKPELVGEYRNIPVVGSREPFFTNKEYAPHYNLQIIMATYVNMINDRLDDIDNNMEEKHLLTRIAYLHNKFLNEIHPFADGNGRVCRILIGAVLMANDCPPIFPEITTQAEQVAYITAIVNSEKEKDDKLLVKYFAEGMTNYLLKRIDE